MRTEFGDPVDDSSRLEVTTNGNGFEFELEGMWVNIHMHNPTLPGWFEDRESGTTYVIYYPEFSILVVQPWGW